MCGKGVDVETDMFWDTQQSKCHSHQWLAVHMIEDNMIEEDEMQLNPISYFFSFDMLTLYTITLLGDLLLLDSNARLL
jgi:hypothetical protein